MPKHPSDALSVEKRASRGSGPVRRHILPASLLLVAWLTSTVFVTLYRAPLPSDAFAALAVQLASAAVPGAD